MITVTALFLTCHWFPTGVQPYVGTPEQALAHYSDLPADVRDTLARRIDAGQADGVLTISKFDLIDDTGRRFTGLTDMHFGRGSRCAFVSRDRWPVGHVERSPVYCEQGHCVTRPLVCGNISRVFPIDGGRSILPPAAPEGGVPGGTGLVPPVPPPLPAGMPTGELSVDDPYSLPGLSTGGSFMSAAATGPGGSTAAIPGASTVLPPGAAMAAPPLVLAGPDDVAPIPEPGTLFLMALGISIMLYQVRRNQRWPT